MRNFTFTFVAGALLWGLAGCSSTTNESTTTSTAEQVPKDKTPVPSEAEVVKVLPGPADNDSIVASLDSTSFQAMVISNDIAEIQSGMQAKAKARNAEVKKFADQMVTAHTNSSQEFTKIAAGNYKLPNNMVPAQQRMVDKLSREKDMDEFDKEYMDLQVSLHQDAINTFELASRTQSNPAFKSYAASQLPHLRSHLEMAKNTRKMVK